MELKDLLVPDHRLLHPQMHPLNNPWDSMLDLWLLLSLLTLLSRLELPRTIPTSELNQPERTLSCLKKSLILEESLKSVSLTISPMIFFVA